jgi:hypothetical protein
VCGGDISQRIVGRGVRRESCDRRTVTLGHAAPIKKPVQDEQPEQRGVGRPRQWVAFQGIQNISRPFDRATTAKLGLEVEPEEAVVMGVVVSDMEVAVHGYRDKSDIDEELARQSEGHPDLQADRYRRPVGRATRLAGATTTGGPRHKGMPNVASRRVGRAGGRLAFRGERGTSRRGRR